jgi:hypothetical protein
LPVEEAGSLAARAAAETTLRPDCVVYTGAGGLMPLAVTGNDCERASEAVDARRASTLLALCGWFVPETGGCPFPIDTAGLAPADPTFVNRELEVIANADPGRALGTLEIPGLAIVVCFPPTLPLMPPFRDASECPRLVEGLGITGRRPIEEGGRGASNSSKA